MLNRASLEKAMAPPPVLLPGNYHGQMSLENCSPCGCWGVDTTERLHFLFHFHALEKEIATHFSVLVWRIPGMGEPGGLPSMGSHRVGHNWNDLAAAEQGFPGGASGEEPTCQCRRPKRHRFNPWVGKTPWIKSRQPTPVFLSGESQGWGSLVGCHLWGRTESDMTGAT